MFFLAPARTRVMKSSQRLVILGLYCCRFISLTVKDDNSARVINSRNASISLGAETWRPIGCVQPVGFRNLIGTERTALIAPNGSGSSAGFDLM